MCAFVRVREKDRERALRSGAPVCCATSCLQREERVGERQRERERERETVRSEKGTKTGGWRMHRGEAKERDRETGGICSVGVFACKKEDTVVGHVRMSRPDGDTHTH